MRISQSSSDWRKDPTMISMATIRLKLKTMAPMLIATRRGVACNCAIASITGGKRHAGKRCRDTPASQGITSIVPSRISAMAV